MKGWMYGTRIIINSSVALIDYQVMFTLVKDGTSSGSTVGITSTQVQPNFQDIRFTDIRGHILPYWIRDDLGVAPTDNAECWVKIPYIPIGTSQIYLYWGNSSAPKVGSGREVFDWFMHGNQLGNSPNYSIYGINYSYPEASAIRVGGNYDTYLLCGDYLTCNCQFVARLKAPASGTNNGFNVGFADLAFQLGFGGVSTNLATWVYVPGNYNWVTASMSSYMGAYNLYKVDWKDSLSNIKFYVNSTLIRESTTITPSRSQQPIYICATGANFYADIDWAYVRKYVSGTISFTYDAVAPVKEPIRLPINIKSNQLRRRQQC